MSITWNGVSSDTIGVVVERIPNRYVPTRRFSPQQVAGRNGNILLVDKSFPNVEQEYEVYLSAEAQGLPSVARACAEWLMGPDGYCRLEDSYDTTVYREAFLMGGYDLENILNKFGRCTITFSCKPQKYLLTGDTPISIPAGSTTTYTGSSVQFDGITGASITSLYATIDPIQDLHGYANPWPAGGGKNKAGPLEIGSFSESSAAGTSYSNMRIVSDRRLRSIDLIPINGQQVTVSWSDYVNYAVCFTYYDSDGLYLGASSGFQSWRWAKTTINNASIYYIACAVKRADNALMTSTDIDGVHLQVEFGSTATEWTPYENICPISGLTGLSVYVSPTQDPDDATVYNVDWSTQAGTVYHGTVDPVTGQLTVDRASVLFDGTQAVGLANWRPNSSSVGWLYTPSITPGLLNVEINSSNLQSCGLLSDTLETVVYGGSSGVYGSGNPCISMVGGASWGVAMRLNDITLTTAAKINEYLSANPIRVIYKLATPLTYQLSAQEIGVLVGENNVWTSSGPVSATVVTPLGGIVTNPTPFEARPMLEVSGVGEITINGKTIQILESVSDFQIDCEGMEAEDNSKIYCMDFPYLEGGENEIVGDGSITAMTVTPRWWTL